MSLRRKRKHQRSKHHITQRNIPPIAPYEAIGTVKITGTDFMSGNNLRGLSDSQANDICIVINILHIYLCRKRCGAKRC